MAVVLSPTMTVRDFENGYWYAVELRDFAKRIGIPAAAKLRKDRIEHYTSNRETKDFIIRQARLMAPEVREKFVCYINFLAEFLAREKGATHADARAAWIELKALDVPKDYASWTMARAKPITGHR